MAQSWCLSVNNALLLALYHLLRLYLLLPRYRPAPRREFWMRPDPTNNTINKNIPAIILDNLIFPPALRFTTGRIVAPTPGIPQKGRQKLIKMAPHSPARGPIPELIPNAKAKGVATIPAVSPPTISPSRFAKNSSCCSFGYLNQNPALI